MPAMPSELLAGLTDAEAEPVLALGTDLKLLPGDVLFTLGKEADCLYVIRQGRIALTLPMRVGGRDEDVLVEERTAGQTVGWSALIPPHRFTLKATAPLATDLLAVPRARLLHYCEMRPDVGYRVAMNVAAIVGQRLQVVQAMWLREIQRFVELKFA